MPAGLDRQLTTSGLADLAFLQRAAVAGSSPATSSGTGTIGSPFAACFRMTRLPLTPELQVHVDRYSQSHQNRVNQVCHFVGIPLLMISALGLVRRSSLVAGAVAAVWYAKWDVRMALPLAGVFSACNTIGRRFSRRELLAIFGMGSGLHLIGHYGFEHKPPAFLSRPVAVFEAPAWLAEKTFEWLRESSTHVQHRTDTTRRSAGTVGSE